MKPCWCGNTSLIFFSTEYSICSSCNTLISQIGLSHEQLQVTDDDKGFYGKEYWLEHQSDNLGFPDIYKRARNDLSERNLHWLKTLLKYLLPPANILELGCSHGSFVALLRQAGYNATGVEMSPWVVELGQKTFGVPIIVGPVETLEIEEGSLDAIVLMDVLEHLPYPVATINHCLKLLRPEGILLVQTPQFKKGMDYETLIETNSAFLEMLQSDEHLYLFSEESVRHLFRQLGAEHIQFEQAIFSRYDMFFAVSRSPMHINSVEETESYLLGQPNGRLALALLDLRERELDLTRRLDESEMDRAARLEQIEALSAMLKESEADRAARLERIEALSAMLKESEADRAARLERIEALSEMLKESEADRAVRLEQIVTLTAMLKK